MTNVIPQLYFLGEFSSKDVKWDTQKTRAVELSQRLDTSPKIQGKLRNCASILRFDRVESEGKDSLKLKSAFLCRSRVCPVCQWRRSLMWFGRFMNALPEILEDYPSARFLSLTLTVRNCEMSDLRATLTHMNASWQRLTQRKAFSPVLGWAKGIEVTRNSNVDSEWNGTVHPHIHALLMVKPSYFTGKSYLSHESWVKHWASCLRVDYEPSLRIQTIKPKNPLPRPVPRHVPSARPPMLRGVSQDNAMKAAICETFKYAVKPQDLVLGGSWVIDLLEQLRNVRVTSLGGVFRDYLAGSEEEEDENLISSGVGESGYGEQVVFNFREDLKRYRQFA